MNLIFDIDGTLWNTTGVIAEAWQAAADSTGISKSRVTADILKNEFGKTMDVIAHNVFPDVNDDSRLMRLIEECDIFEMKTLRELTPTKTNEIIYNGVCDTLKALAAGNRLFIVSNCQLGYIDMFADKSGTADLFEDTLCYGDTGTAKGETIRTLMKKNSLEAEETFYIGDTAGDYEASSQAGIRMIFCSYGFGEVELPYKKIEYFKDLLSIF